MKHDWVLDEYGDIDDWRLDEEYHNGQLDLGIDL